MPAPCVPSPCHAVAHLCIVMLCQCKGLHISTVPTLRRATPRRINSFRFQCGSSQVHALTKQLSAIPSPRFALPIPSLPCRCISIPRFAQPLRNVSLQIHSVSLPSLHLALLFHSHASLCVSVAGPLLCDTTLCRAETVQIESMLCLYRAMLYRALDMPDLAATMLCLSLRRGAVPMPSSSLPCQNTANQLIANTKHLPTMPKQLPALLFRSLSLLHSSNTMPFKSLPRQHCAVHLLDVALFLRNRSALPPTTEPSSPISSHTNAPLPEFRHWPRPLYLP